MRANVSRYDLRAPDGLTEALHLVSNGWKPLAGGTDLMVLLEAGKLAERRLAGLWKLDELRGIEVGDETITLGALTIFAELRHSPVVGLNLPLLASAAAEIGGVANQNRATLGGNLANASPAADAAPALLVYDAELEIVSLEGTRRVPYHQFHRGYKEMDLRAGELIARIHLPNGRGRWQGCWRKVATRAAQAITKVSLAAAARVEEGRIAEIRIAYGAVAPYPLRCHRMEAALRGAALPAQLPPFDELAPIDDFRSTARYRLKVARNLMETFLASLA
ncbi:MAG: FAD binding domain-containing protein [Bryobacteraceae bacterium]|nr:FAD binding domain-containing protein [Bryobacteraceae bacterium]